jgi:adenosylcobinamide-GDP ribazoletransferase
MRRAISFLTPLGGPTTPSPAAVAWFPVVGVLVGLVLSAAWWVATEAWPAPVAAAVVVAADLGLTGFLHLDGLVDASDGLLPPLDRQRRLEVMADPSAGAFGVGAAVAVLLLRWVALAALAPSVVLLPAIWCASRTAMAVTTRAVPYARPGGLASSFRSAEKAKVAPLAIGGITAAMALGLLASGLAGLSGVLACLLTAGAVVGLGVRRVGGFTGDVLGAAGLVGETAGLLVAAARW